MTIKSIASKPIKYLAYMGTKNLMETIQYQIT